MIYIILSCTYISCIGALYQVSHWSVINRHLLNFILRIVASVAILLTEFHLIHFLHSLKSIINVHFLIIDSVNVIQHLK